MPGFCLWTEPPSHVRTEVQSFQTAEASCDIDVRARTDFLVGTPSHINCG